MGRIHLKQDQLFFPINDHKQHCFTGFGFVIIMSYKLVCFCKKIPKEVLLQYNVSYRNIEQHSLWMMLASCSYDQVTFTERQMQTSMFYLLAFLIEDSDVSTKN